MPHCDIFSQKTGFICDMDGVIYHGNRLLPTVGDFLTALKTQNKKSIFN